MPGGCREGRVCFCSFWAFLWDGFGIVGRRASVVFVEVTSCFLGCGAEEISPVAVNGTVECFWQDSVNTMSVAVMTLEGEMEWSWEDRGILPCRDTPLLLVHPIGAWSSLEGKGIKKEDGNYERNKTQREKDKVKGLLVEKAKVIACPLSESN